MRTGNDRRLRGRIAIVTGASGHIGLAIARRFLAAGARVALLDLDRAALRGAAARLRAEGRRFRRSIRTQVITLLKT